MLDKKASPRAECFGFAYFDSVYLMIGTSIAAVNKKFSNFGRSLPHWSGVCPMPIASPVVFFVILVVSAAVDLTCHIRFFLISEKSPPAPRDFCWCLMFTVS